MRVVTEKSYLLYGVSSLATHQRLLQYRSEAKIKQTAPYGAEAVAERRPTTGGSRAKQCGSVYQGCERIAYHLSRHQTCVLLVRRINASADVQSFLLMSSSMIMKSAGMHLMFSVLTVATCSKLPAL